jgi:outer membrane protein assembly factor BamB
MLPAIRGYLLPALCCAGLVAAADWPAFRGPNISGVADTTGLPVEFGPTANVVWKTPLPSGTSSPVLTKDRLFITGYENSSLVTLCLDRQSGKVAWRGQIEQTRNSPRHKLNSPASATPVTDGENVFVFFADFGLLSYDRDGRERWRLPLGPFSSLHGMGTSPILFGEKLILVCDQDTDSFLLALDKRTGKTIWKVERPEVVHGFATPTIFRPPGQEPQLIVPGSYQVEAYSPQTGRKLWWVRGLTWQVKPSAVVSDDTVFVTGWAPGADAGERKDLPPFDVVLKEADQNGDRRISKDELPVKWRHSGSWDFIDLNRDGVLDEREWEFYRARRSAQNVTMAICPGEAKGDLTSTHVAWTYDRSVPQVSSPLLYKDVLYTIRDGGILTAFESKTGAILKQARLRGATDAYYASPVAAEGKLYIASETGKISVVTAAREWELETVNDLDENCYATPALADSRIYLRTRTTLYCFGKNEQ